MAPRQKSSSSTIATAVRAAQKAAKDALQRVRSEIADTEKKLAELRDLAGSLGESLPSPSGKSRPARKRKSPAKKKAAGRKSGKTVRRRARKGAGKKSSARKKTPQAEKFFAKLPKSFSLDDVRKLAGRRAGVSLAQWSRSKRIRKMADGTYKKLA